MGAPLNMLVEHGPDGTYRVSTGSDGMQWVQWDPRRSFRFATWSYGAGETFRREATELATGLGFACLACGYLEFEHNIDGEEKAPCGGFVDRQAPGTKDTLPRED